MCFIYKASFLLKNAAQSDAPVYTLHIAFAFKLCCEAYVSGEYKVLL